MMLATHSAIKVAKRTDVDDDALDRLMNDGPEPPVSFFSDESFGTAAECAADALFVKRLSLIVVPAVLLLCLLTLVLA